MVINAITAYHSTHSSAVSLLPPKRIRILCFNPKVKHLHAHIFPPCNEDTTIRSIWRNCPTLICLIARRHLDGLTFTVPICCPKPNLDLRQFVPTPGCRAGAKNTTSLRFKTCYCCGREYYAKKDQKGIYHKYLCIKGTKHWHWSITNPACFVRFHSWFMIYDVCSFETAKSSCYVIPDRTPSGVEEWGKLCTLLGRYGVRL